MIDVCHYGAFRLIPRRGLAPGAGLLPVFRSAFEEVLTLEASPMLLLLLDAAPEPEPLTPGYSTFQGIAGPVFVFLT